MATAKIKQQPRVKRWEIWLTPILAVLVFAVLGFANLHQAIWYDEAYSAYLVKGDFGQIWEMTSIDVHPPFYYFCLKVWSQIFGRSDLALRSMGVCFAALGIVLAYIWLRRKFGQKAATLATFALCLSPLLIRYSQEMRMYGVVFAIVMGATLVLDIALKQKSKLAWLGYGLLICLGMYTHYFTALAWLAQFGFIAWYFWKNGLQKMAIVAYIMAILLYLPWLPFFWQQTRSVQNGFWIDPVSAATPLSFLTESLVYREAVELGGWLILPVLVMVVVLIGLIVRTWRKLAKAERCEFAVVLVMAFVPPALLMLLSLPPFEPTYMTRYVVYAASMVWAIIGLLVYWGRKYNKKWQNIAFVLLAGFCAITGILTVNMREGNGDVASKEMIAQLSQTTAAPILIHVHSQHYFNLMFYEEAEHPIYAFNVNFEWGSLEPIRQYGQNHLEVPEDFVAQQDEFWVVTEQNDENEYEFEGFETAEFKENWGLKAHRMVRKRAAE